MTEPTFTPTDDWQDLPEGAICPPGLEYRLSLGPDGRRQARRRPSNPIATPADPLESDLTAAALAYAKMGWAIHPLIPTDKRPLLKDWPNRATSDPATVAAWWAENPMANIGLACGPSGLVAIDLDVKPDRDGRKSWAELLTKKSIEAGDPLVSKTPSGGQHRIYRANGTAIPNSAGKLGPGIDVRGDGGYIVLPPSILDAGAYAWEVGPSDHRAADLPAELVAMLTRRAAPPGRPAPYPTPSRNYTAYAQAAFEGELDKLAQAREGERNQTLNRAAYNLGQLIGAGWLDRADVESALLGVATLIGLPEAEALRTIRSGLDAGLANPRRPPERTGGLATVTATAGLAYEPPPANVVVELAQYNRTDLGNAERLKARHGDDLRYCALWGKWLVWDGRRWTVDETRAVERAAVETVRDLYAEAAQSDSQEKREELAKWARASEADGRRSAMVHSAGAILPTHPSELDRDPWLLTVENGTLDLQTGELLAHRRADMQTKLAPVAYDPQAQAPTWLAFLDRIMDSNTNLIGFLQRAIGYSLTGDTREQAIFIAHGTGANGKSTLVETLMALLGDYGTKTPVETLMLKKGAGGIPADVARLRGARFVAASEGEQGQRLAESLVKSLAGQDTITARFLYGEFFEFRPVLKLWLATNHKPRIRGTDLAIWRRIKLIPFGVTIPEAEQDKQLGERLRAELPGILAWAVAGCLDWQQNGLGTPPEVREATATYQAEEDTLAGFLDECCELRPGLSCPVGAVYARYKEWCESNGEQPSGPRGLGQMLKERGLEQRKGTGGKRLWLGLGLVATEAKAEAVK